MADGPKTVDEVREHIKRGAALVLDQVPDGPHAECACARCTASRELRAAGYWLGPGVIWIPPGGAFGAM